MNYGTYLSTGGVLASMRRMDVIANNLANATTIGFKPDLVTALERPAERVEGLSPLSDPLAPPQEMLERLGGGLKFAPDRIDFRQGELERSGNASDLALRGGGFFVVGPAKGKMDPKGPIDLTRAGNFVVDSDGTFRASGSNRPIMGEGGEPVRIDPRRPYIVDKVGRVVQGDTEVARFRVVKPRQPAGVEKVGGNLFRTSGGVDRVADDETSVEQHMTELSVADPVTAMVDLMRESRMLEANVRMIQYQDNLTGQAISGITRVG